MTRERDEGVVVGYVSTDTAGLCCLTVGDLVAQTTTLRARCDELERRIDELAFRMGAVNEEQARRFLERLAEEAKPAKEHHHGKKERTQGA